MIKLSDLKKEHKQLLGTDTSELTKPQISKVKKRIQFLKTCIAYMESEPTETFVKSEMARIKKRIELINNQYEDWNPGKNFTDGKKKFKAYLKENNVPLLKIQNNTLKFLLNN